MDALIGVTLGDGRLCLLTEKELAAGLARAAAHPLFTSQAAASPAPQERMLSSAEAAALCGVSSTTLEGMVAAGTVRAHRFGRELRALRFLPSELTEDTRSIPTPQRRLK
jgi:excisionase family DNA binding protein